MLHVPAGLEPDTPVPLLLMFHGAGGHAAKVMPFLQEHAEAQRFLLLVPQSQFVTWDIVIGGNGPDLERLDQALASVASHFLLDRQRIGFAGFSDGGSYALSTGLSNGELVSHIMVFSGGFMSVLQPQGQPRVFMSHGLVDEQLPIDTSARLHTAKLKAAGYNVEHVEFNGQHAIQPSIVALAVDFFLKT
jgi:predicted esterase